MKQIKYEVVTRKTVRRIVWGGLFTGAALYVLVGAYGAYSGDLIAKGLETVGIVIMASTLAFFAGMHFKVDPKSK